MGTRDRRQTTLVVEQSRELRRYFRIRNKQTGEMIDPTDEGYTSATLEVRDTTLSEGGELLMQMTTDNGGVVLGEVNDGHGGTWSGYIYAPVSITKELEPWGEGVFDLVAFHSGGAVDTVARGPAVLIPTVTEVS